MNRKDLELRHFKALPTNSIQKLSSDKEEELVNQVVSSLRSDDVTYATSGDTMVLGDFDSLYPVVYVCKVVRELVLKQGMQLRS